MGPFNGTTLTFAGRRLFRVTGRTAPAEASATDPESSSNRRDVCARELSFLANGPAPRRRANRRRSG